MAGSTITAGYPEGLLKFAASRGADRETLLQRSGIDPEALKDQDNRIPFERYVALLDAAIELTGEPALALQFGEQVRMKELSILGLISEACETPAELAQQTNRYGRLSWDPGQGEPEVHTRITQSSDGLWIEGASQVYADHPRITEGGFAQQICNTRVLFAASPAFQALKFPKALHFKHEEPTNRDHRAEYDRIFRCPITFSSRWNALLVDVEFTTVRLPPKNRYVFGVLSKHAEALLRSLETSRTTRGKVETVLMPILHTGEVAMDQIAERMGIGRKTLYRSLKAEGVTFELLLDELRHKVALHYLGEGQVSVNQAAYLVGFSDPAAFSRAFKRWTGTSPSRVGARKIDS